jgi:hypothetical protein
MLVRWSVMGFSEEMAVSDNDGMMVSKNKQKKRKK